MIEHSPISPLYRRNNISRILFFIKILVSLSLYYPHHKKFSFLFIDKNCESAYSQHFSFQSILRGHSIFSTMIMRRSDLKSLSNEACSSIVNGCYSDAIVQLNSALLTIMDEISSTIHGKSIAANEQGGVLEECASDNDAQLELLCVASAAFTGSIAHHQGENSTLSVSCSASGNGVSNNTCDGHVASGMRTICARPMKLSQHQYENSSLHTLSFIVTFNLALAFHLRGIDLLGLGHPPSFTTGKLGAIDGAENEQQSRLPFHRLVHQEGMTALTNAKALYGLTFGVLKDVVEQLHDGGSGNGQTPLHQSEDSHPPREATVRRMDLLFAMILNNLSQISKTLGETREAAGHDELLLQLHLRHLLDPPCGEEQGRPQSPPPRSVLVTPGGEISPGSANAAAQHFLDVVLENVWYLFARRLSAPAASAA
jgi:hypothetical protein